MAKPTSSLSLCIPLWEVKLSSGKIVSQSGANKQEDNRRDSLWLNKHVNNEIVLSEMTQQILVYWNPGF